MKKIVLVALALAVLLVAGFYALNAYMYHEKQGDPENRDPNGQGIAIGEPNGKRPAPERPEDAIYVIEGAPVELLAGTAEAEAAPGSSTKVTTKYFGNAVSLDIDKDGREDTVFLLTQSTGGSGTFYYVVAALNTTGGYIGSEAYLLGDRIAPQTTEIVKGKDAVVAVNYADRKPGESFAALPSVGKTVWLKLDPVTMQFGTVEQYFEGEADPSRMTLSMKEWTWISTLYNDEREVKPRAGKTFTVTFGKDGRFSAKTDCNSIGGNYTTKDSQITFGAMMMTKMYCEGSQEADFAEMLEHSTSYHFSGKGELILDLKFDSGSVVFK